MLYLATKWFCQNPNKADAIDLFEDFFTTNAPMRVESILPEIFVEMEAVLNDSDPTPQRLRRVFDRAHQCVIAVVATALEHFESMVTMGGLGSLYGAGLLVDLKTDEVQMVVEEMIKVGLFPDGCRCEHACVGACVRVCVCLCVLGGGSSRIRRGSGDT